MNVEYHECLTLSRLVARWLHAAIRRLQLRGVDSRKIYWIDATVPAQIVFFFLPSKWSLTISQLSFRLVEVRNRSGEIIRLVIPSEALFSLQSQVIERCVKVTNIPPTGKMEPLINYFHKSLLGGGVHQASSIGRALLLINVVASHASRLKAENALLFLEKRVFVPEIQAYARKKGIGAKCLLSRRITPQSAIHEF